MAYEISTTADAILVAKELEAIKASVKMQYDFFLRAARGAGPLKDKIGVAHTAGALHQLLDDTAKELEEALKQWEINERLDPPTTHFIPSSGLSR